MEVLAQHRHGSGNSSWQAHLVPVGAVILIVLAGYYKLFLGANFFTDENWISISNNSYGNALGNGWRPDKGLGISHFFADPGVWHAWSIYTLVENIFHDRVIAYNFSTLFISILTAIAQYFLIRKIAPRSSAWMAVFVAPLVVFCADQAANHFARNMTASIFGFTLLPMLLYDHFQNPKRIHYFFAALFFWFVPFASNMWWLFQQFTISLFFSVFYSIYFKVRFQKVLPKLIAILVSGCLGFVLLGCWAVYPTLVEKSLMEYTRERLYVAPQMTMSLVPDWAYCFNYLVGLLQSAWFPFDNQLIGVGPRPFIYTFNFSVIFPFVFLFFLFRRARSFWEFSFKWFLVIYLIHYFLEAIPFYKEAYVYLCANTSRIFTIYEQVFSAQVGLTALFISIIGQQLSVIDNRFGRKLQSILALTISCLFGLLAILAICAIFWPDLLISSVKQLMYFVPEKIRSHPRELIQAVFIYNIERFRDVMHWYTVVFYLTSCFLVAIFIKPKWILWASKQSQVIIALLLLINGILLSWSIHPLNTKEFVWKTLESQYHFALTDRFYFVAQNKTSEKNLEYFKKKYFEIEGGGPRERRRTGLLDTPGLNLSALKSFDAKQNWDFLYHIFNGDGTNRVEMRLNYGGPVFVSDLLDMCAVKYYFSEDELTDLPSTLTLYAKTKQLYVYKNLSAWPYYYLAQRLGLKKEKEHLRDVQAGTAYLEQKDWFDLPSTAGQGNISLKTFSYGTMVFDYDSPTNEFLVVADSWHPFWKAKIEDKSLPVIRANEVFKGVRLPAGRHEVTMYFDTSAYKPGIYISMVAWVLFFVGFWKFWGNDEVLTGSPVSTV